MADYPALPLWTDRYLADTRHLSSPAEHGAYLLLLMEAWRRPDCSLPDDDALLARLVCSTPEAWAVLKPVVMAFWALDKRSGKWTQKGLLREREFLSKTRVLQKNRVANRWNKTKNTLTGLATDDVQNDDKKNVPVTHWKDTKKSLTKKHTIANPEKSVSVNHWEDTKKSLTPTPTYIDDRTYDPVNLTDSPLLFSDSLTSNQIQEVSSLRSETASAREFDAFWVIYPNKVGKGDARKAFEKALKRTDLPALMAGLDRYIHKTDDRPWCNPATWLNQDRWEDSPADAPVRKSRMEQIKESMQRRFAGDGSGSEEQGSSDFHHVGGVSLLAGK